MVRLCRRAKVKWEMSGKVYSANVGTCVKLEESGYVRLPHAFPRSDAEAMADFVWDRLADLRGMRWIFRDTANETMQRATSGAADVSNA